MGWIIGELISSVWEAFVAHVSKDKPWWVRAFWITLPLMPIAVVVVGVRLLAR